MARTTRSSAAHRWRIRYTILIASDRDSRAWPSAILATRDRRIDRRFNMGTDGYVLGLVGSPNRDGRTFQMVSTALEAAATMGARVELVQMADHVVAPCRDCQPW